MGLFRRYAKYTIVFRGYGNMIIQCFVSCFRFGLVVIHSIFRNKQSGLKSNADTFKIELLLINYTEHLTDAQVEDI
jgi:hypothetical protein